jgi:energy-coupling factor transporter ATP-binding protein EcfA2
MVVDRNKIENALNELISYEEGVRFQSLAVVLAKQKWPDLIASERKWDLGLDAYVPTSVAADGKSKALSCSITATVDKISKDAERIKNKFTNITVLIFYTPQKVTNHTAASWADEIKKTFGYDLVVVSREDIITSLMDPANLVLCRTHLRIEVPLDQATDVLLGKARDATREEVEHWLSHPRLSGQPFIALQAIKLDERAQETEEIVALTDVQAWLVEGRRIILEGPGGSGKTTTLIQLAKQQSDASRLGFLIDFPVWVRSRQPILEFIARRPPFQLRGLEPADLARLCTTEHFSFLLNGWNEISEVYSEEAVRTLADLERSFRTAGIIIATRTHHIKPPLPGSFRLKLLALKRAQRNGYLRQALGGHATTLITQLEGNRALDELTRTPFILSKVAKLFENGRPIPPTKLDVLDAVMQLIEESDEHCDHLQRLPLSGRATNYLANLAFEMTAHGHVDIDEEQARRIVYSVSHGLRDAGQIATVPEPASILSALCAHHVLERLAYPSVAFRFQHQQIQEFYAASRLTRLLSGLVAEDHPDRIRDFQAGYLNMPMWGEPLRMIAEAIGAGSLAVAQEIDVTTMGKRLIEWSIPLGCSPETDTPPGPLGGLLSQGQFPQVTVLTHLNDSDAEVRREKRPSGSPSVALLETAHSEDGLLAVSPAHAGAFHPLGRERLARRFDHPTTNGQPSRLITGIVHALPLVFEVRKFGVEQCATPLVLLATPLASQSRELGDHVVSTAGLVPEYNPQAFILGASLDALLAIVRCHGSAKMLAGMPMVDDFRGLVVDRPLEVAPVFLCTIGKRYHRQIWPHGKNRSPFRIELFG